MFDSERLRLPWRRSAQGVVNSLGKQFVMFLKSPAQYKDAANRADWLVASANACAGINIDTLKVLPFGFFGFRANNVTIDDTSVAVLALTARCKELEEKLERVTLEKNEETARLDAMELNKRDAIVKLDNGDEERCYYYGVSAAPGVTLREAIDILRGEQ